MNELTSRNTFAIIAPPPTPNGDLHVGHLSGPYLGADILSRYLKLRGKRVVSALSVDLNQTYVVTTAQRLKRNPVELAEQSYLDVTETLKASAIGFDVVGMPDADYTDYITGWFRRLALTGVLKLRQRDVPYDIEGKRFMFESYASGWCTVCLSETNGNVCETCGHANDPGELYGLYPTGGTPDSKVEFRSINEYVIDMEAWRRPLENHLRNCIPELRPALRRLIDEILSRPLPPFPVTFPSAWGIPAPFEDADGLVLNVWAEMVPGHYYWLNKASRDLGHSGQVIGRSTNAGYVQFLGFDNSFFYTIAHVVLALCAREVELDALLPTAFVTNEFLQLNNFKFSTSQGHLIWGRDLLSEAPLDDVRFYLAWANPEYNQANFSRTDFSEVSTEKFRSPLEALLPRLNALNLGDEAPATCPIANSFTKRFEAAYDPDQPSWRIAALTLANGLKLTSALIARNASRGSIRRIVQSLAAGAAPLVPETATRLWAAAGQTGAVKWPAAHLEEEGQLRRIA